LQQSRRISLIAAVGVTVLLALLLGQYVIGMRRENEQTKAELRALTEKQSKICASLEENVRGMEEFDRLKNGDPTFPGNRTLLGREASGMYNGAYVSENYCKSK
jgi:siroheme synthase